MKINQSLLGIIGAIAALNCFAGQVSTLPAQTASPVGYWKSIDELSGKTKSIIQISKSKDEEILEGKIIKIFPRIGNAKTKVCAACKGDKHNQPIVGMVILTGLKKNQKEWNQGKILDPENGKIYSCTAHIAEDGNKLNVRGYIGLPLLGRSQLWERVDTTIN